MSDVPTDGVYSHTNALAGETSRYLLQHAHNPVDWHPWGPEAIALAREQDKPIFLSIGYSACYWCHVMERECFENESIAALMNEYFVCIKVDREERPDVDDIYMTAVQIMTGSGGWPLSAWLLPDTLEPFYGGTYFPPQDAMGRPGFPSVLKSLHQFWVDNPAAVRQQGQQVGSAVQQALAAGREPVAVDRAQVDATVSQLVGAYDREHAGFSKGGNKFPMPVNHEFLLEAAWDVRPARTAVLHTLDRMAMGGMYDQIGGGFHRYSVDDKWLVPHFEKMLYDNAMLASVYADAYEKTGDKWYGTIAEEILDWVLREMTSDSGCFYSALDAESNAKEGESYLWTPEQIQSVLEAAELQDEVAFALDVYGLGLGANFQDPHHPESPPSNVLFLQERPHVTAERLGLASNEFDAKIAVVNAALLASRDQRDQPGLDQKVIAGWNGLMIGGMADGGRLLEHQRYIDAAEAAADDLMSTMWSSSGGLMRSRRDGKGRIPAFLEDYAYLIRGLLRLEEASSNSVRLDQAASLATQAKERFWDEQSGGWFETLDAQDDLLVRGRSFYDGAMPSANAVMINNMIDLYEQTGKKSYGEDAVAGLSSVSSEINESPRGVVHSVQALHRLESKHTELIRETTTVKKAPGSHVAFSADVRQVRLGIGESATVTLTLTIDEGWHVNANQQQDEFALPLEILSMTEGLQVYPQYPPGQIFAGPEGQVNVYEGTVEIPITVTCTGSLGRSGRMTVTWQSCNDRTCLMPKTEAVPIKVLPPVGS
jgi:uncharacterized protein YyaL (SSP411 family)